MTTTDLSTLIRDARKEAGITQQELAERVGVTKPTVNQFETGKQNITIDLLVRLCNELGVRLITANEERLQKVEQIISIAKEL